MFRVAETPDGMDAIQKNIGVAEPPSSTSPKKNYSTNISYWGDGLGSLTVTLTLLLLN
jgi:hypothetical protein